MEKNITYRGFVITKNINPQFGTPYISVLNPRLKNINGKLIHTHCSNINTAKRIIDCLKKMKNGGVYWKYTKNIRNKAMRLGGSDILTR